MTRALEREEAKEARVVPILLRPCDWQHTPLARLQFLPQDGKPLSQQPDQDQAWTDITAGLRRVLEDLQLLPAIARQSSLPALWNIPYAPNPFFLGRDELLQRLHTQLQSGQSAALSQPRAISGLGGIGKTQLAVHYAYLYGSEYQAVLWARAENQEALTTSYSALATLLKLPERDAQEQQITIQAVKSWLQSHANWLLILDNADDLDLLPAFLPPIIGGHVLITTRAKDMQRLAQRIDVETLSPEQGTLFLLRRASLLQPDQPFEQALPDEQILALQLTQELGGLPLALDQAGAYVEATRISLQQYQQLYQHQRRDLLNERRSRLADHPEPVATTWSLAFQRVQERSAAAADLLRLCAFLAPDAIPEELITEGVKVLTDLHPPSPNRWFDWFGKRKEHPPTRSDLPALATDPQLLNQAIEALRAYSLLDRDPRTQQLSLHRLVQAVLKDQMDAATEKLWAERTVQVVDAAFPFVEHKTWPLCEQLLPHALLAADMIEHYQLIFPAASLLLNQTGVYLYERARYGEAERLYERALGISERQLGGEHPDTAGSLNNLAGLYESQGRYEEAEPLYERALEIRERQLGGEHPDTATSLNNLAALYRGQGRYEEAEPLLKRALGIYERQLGEEHPETARGLNNLAGLYHDLGRIEDAERLFRRALAIREHVLGPEHPDTANSLFWLAYSHHQWRQYERAQPLYERALAIRERALGPDHPDTLNLRGQYVSLLRDMEGGVDEEG